VVKLSDSSGPKGSPEHSASCLLNLNNLEVGAEIEDGNPKGRESA
jgi:hypothetical protein